MSIKFDPEQHIRNVSGEPDVALVNSFEEIIPGIRGVPGAAETIALGTIGIDRIMMEVGSEFELHTHPGAHILYVLSSRGYIHVDGTDYAMTAGDTIFVPADYAHGVKTDRAAKAPLEILAFGVPHMPLDSAHRMELVER
ncbi:cupin domain-containing protein [Kitasatospora viridis]|uniref:Cupin domain n=1 Tax=Kitasatospora viridis TaxID=281105 RepID=A0A561UAB2_9ACTN|nr:cupin domain-containing protein [Kitasatospora viridis]TWF96305.1 cupin domain [Kitasatospora viridis]